jgi:hypothetical protein
VGQVLTRCAALRSPLANLTAGFSVSTGSKAAFACSRVRPVLEGPRRCGPSRIEAVRATGVQAETELAFAAGLGQNRVGEAPIGWPSASVLHHGEDLVLGIPKPGSHCSCRSMSHGSHVSRLTGQSQECT